MAFLSSCNSKGSVWALSNRLLIQHSYILMESMIFVSQNGKQACALPSYHRNQCLELLKKQHKHIYLFGVLPRRQFVFFFILFCLYAQNYWTLSFLKFHFSWFPFLVSSPLELIIDRHLTQAELTLITVLLLSPSVGMKK